ncbi:MAG: tetratricopeptide (TPR) repeat protein [Bradymonadia bacterium]|jgi:tetratricopeptide (TPR) repeat protein
MLPAIDSLWNYRDPVGTEAKFRGLLHKANTEPAYAAELRTQIARSLGLQRKFEEAHAELDAAEAVATEMALVQVRIALERGRALRSSGAPENALPHFELALKLADTGKFGFYAIDAAHMIALVCEGEDAVRWHEKALAMAEGAEDERARGWRGSLYNNLGWTYHELGRHSDALDLFIKHETILAAAGKTFNESIAKWAQGKMLRALGRLDEALTIQQELLPHPERQADSSEGYTREEIAECLLAMGKTEDAKPFFARAHELLSQDDWLVANEAARLQRLTEFGGV